ncbi:MAG TPA: hypothetical protein VN181_01990, partial [Thermoanaerobaculia bacterium]|nr:hypothetical protein [Thermoanaerobaculia bacterium]
AAGGIALTEQRFYYDLLGRLIQQRRRLPAAAGAQRWSVMETAFDELGRSDKTTVFVEADTGDYAKLPSTTPATKTVYDAFGRAITTTLPDGSVTEAVYTSDRQIKRAALIATSETENTKVWTKEDYDTSGRLLRITENAEAAGGYPALLTTYQYDVGNRLTFVTSGVQHRQFKYDLAGRLLFEEHPESGTTNYQYDARGHVTRRTTPTATIDYVWDSAERLLTVTQSGAGELKAFAYDTPAFPGDHSNGKMVMARRQNRRTTGDVTVTETYRYEDAAGRLTQKNTTASTGEAFVDKYTYNLLGMPESVTYPKCDTCTDGEQRVITNSFDQGMLTGIDRGIAGNPQKTAVASAFSYHANGLLLDVTHNKLDGSPGATDHQTVATNGMPRPESIFVDGFCNLRLTGPNDKSVLFGHAALLQVVATGALSYQWYDATAGTAISGATTDTLSVDPRTGPSKVFVRVTGATCTVDSRTASVTTQTTTNCLTVAPTSVTIQPGHAATFTATVVAGAAVQWYQGSAPDTTHPVATGASFTTPVLTVSTNYWCRVSSGAATCSGADSQTVTAVIGDCTVTLQPPASVVSEGSAFRLTATTFSQATYRWYSGTYAQSTLLATTTTSYYDVAAGITAETSFFVEVQDDGCHVAPGRSEVVTIGVCPKPEARTISAFLLLNGNLTLSIPDNHDNVTFEWFRGNSYADVSAPLGITSEIEVAGAIATYWVRMTKTCGSVTTTANTALFTADLSSAPKILFPPVSRAATMPAAGGNVTLSASVIAGPRGPFTYQWYFANGTAITNGTFGPSTFTGATSATLEWKYIAPASVPELEQKSVYVVVRVGSISARSEPVLLSVSHTGQHIFAYDGSVTNYSASQAATLFVDVDPPADAMHSYTYQWYRDNGTAGGALLTPTTSQITVLPTTVDNYWVKVTGTHKYGTPGANGVYPAYQEETVSPKMRVSVYAACDLPPL